MRSAFSLQLLTITAGSVAGFFFFKGCGGLQLALASVVVSIGVLGLFVVLAIEKARNIHVDRARHVRRLFPQLEEIAQAHRGFLQLAKYFLALNALIIIFGLLLAVFSLYALPSLTLGSLSQCVMK
jgi:hypothetical protein